ncbi:hypothetical protein MRX96_012854 [Rhipicephalus microplus]
MYQHHGTVKDSGGYGKYWATLYFVLSEKHDGSALNKTVVDSLAAIEGDVFRTLLTSMRPDLVYQSPVTVTDIEVHKAPLRSEQWLRASRQNMLAPEVEHIDEVYLSNVEFLCTMAGVMISYQDVELLSPIAWSFVHLLSRAVDYRLLNNRYDRVVTIYVPYFCEQFFETAYRFLVTALSSVSLFS